MKTNILTPLLLLMFTHSFSQNINYNGRRTPAIKKEKLVEVNTLNEIAPELWLKLLMPYDDRVELDKRRTMQDYYLYPQYMNPQQNDYNKIIEYVSVEISTTSNGKILKAQGINDILTTQQKTILNSADLGSDIVIKIKFKYKNTTNASLNKNAKIIDGELGVAVIPYIEAEYPGGLEQVAKQLIDNAALEISEKSAATKIGGAMLKFTVNEEGKIVDAKLVRKSNSIMTDKLLMEVIYKLRLWKPAENANGAKVKQEFTLMLGGEGC